MENYKIRTITRTIYPRITYSTSDTLLLLGLNSMRILNMNNGKTFMDLYKNNLKNQNQKQNQNPHQNIFNKQNTLLTRICKCYETLTPLQIDILFNN
jgi:hypothetical protein